MFDFRIIEISKEVQVIDRTVNTSYDELTPVQLIEYRETEMQLDDMDRLERKTKSDVKRRRKHARNPLYKIACLCGLL